MPVEPTESDLLLEVIKSYMVDVHVALPARVDSYDAATQTVKVTPCVRRARLSDTRSIEKEAIPQIENVPVAWPRGGGFFATMPLKKGDFVSLIFNEASPAVFRTTGEVPSNPGEIKRHGLGDPVAVPGGAFPNSQPIADARDDAAVLGGLDEDDAQVAITDSGEIHLGKQAVEKVGRADRIESYLADIRSEFNGHTHSAGSLMDSTPAACTGATGGPVSRSFPNVPDVGCDIVKGQ